MNIAYSILVYAVWFLSTYFVVVFLLFLLKYKKSLLINPKFKDNKQLPKVSIVVAAYNEGKNIANCISSLKKINYPKEFLEIVVVNDGSKDCTAEAVKKIADGKLVRLIDNKTNMGKAYALNCGINAASGEFVACMDADSFVEKEILMKTMPYFEKKDVGAVTVSVEALHRGNLLGKIIELEYILGLSLLLKIYSLINCVYVTPGPFSIYRKSVLDEIGCFDEKNITEDLEIAYRINKAGHRIACCMSAKVSTIIPDNFRGLYRQRKRWYSGALLTMWQHKDMLLKRKTGLFGLFIPFTYSLITLGLFLFIFSTFLFVSRSLKNISMYALTNFNFLEQFSLKNWDPLSYSIFAIIGVTGLLGTAFVLAVGLKTTKSGFKKRAFGCIGYFLLFFLYQFFWLSSFYQVLAKKEIKW